MAISWDETSDYFEFINQRVKLRIGKPGNTSFPGGTIAQWRIPPVTLRSNSDITDLVAPSALGTINDSNSFRFRGSGGQVTKLTSAFSSSNYTFDIKIKTKALLHFWQEWDFGQEFLGDPTWGTTFGAGSKLRMRWTVTEHQIYWHVEFTRPGTGGTQLAKFEHLIRGKSFGSNANFWGFIQRTEAGIQPLVNSINSGGDPNNPFSSDGQPQPTWTANIPFDVWFGLPYFPAARLMAFGFAQWRYKYVGSAGARRPTNELTIEDADIRISNGNKDVEVIFNHASGIASQTQFGYPMLFWNTVIDADTFIELDFLYEDYSNPVELVDRGGINEGLAYNGHGFDEKLGAYAIGSAHSGQGLVDLEFGVQRHLGNIVDFKWGPIVVIGYNGGASPNPDSNPNGRSFNDIRSPVLLEDSQGSGLRNIGLQKGGISFGQEFFSADYDAAVDRRTVRRDTGAQTEAAEGIGLVAWIGAHKTNDFRWRIQTGGGEYTFTIKHKILQLATLDFTFTMAFQILAQSSAACFFDFFNGLRGTAEIDTTIKWGLDLFGVILQGNGTLILDTSNVGGILRSRDILCSGSELEEMRVVGYFTTPLDVEGGSGVIANCGAVFPGSAGSPAIVASGVVAYRGTSTQGGRGGAPVGTDLLLSFVDDNGTVFEAGRSVGFFVTGGDAPAAPYQIILEVNRQDTGPTQLVSARVLIGDPLTGSEQLIIPAEGSGETDVTRVATGSLATPHSRVGIYFEQLGTGRNELDACDLIEVFPISGAEKPRIKVSGPCAASRVDITLTASDFVASPLAPNQILAQSEWHLTPFGRSFAESPYPTVTIPASDPIEYTFTNLQANSRFMARVRFHAAAADGVNLAENGISEWSMPFFVRTTDAGAKLEAIPSGGQYPGTPPPGYDLVEMQRWKSEVFTWADGSETRTSTTRRPRRQFRLTYPSLAISPDSGRTSDGDVIVRWFERVKGQGEAFYLVLPIEEPDGTQEVIRVRFKNHQVSRIEFAASGQGAVSGSTSSPSQFWVKISVELIESI